MQGRKNAMQKTGIKGQVSYPCRPFSPMVNQLVLQAQTSYTTPKTTLKGLSSKKRCDGGCLCAKLRQNTHKTQEKERYRDGGYMNPNPKTQNPLKMLSKFSNPRTREKGPPLIELQSCKLTRQAS